MNKLATNPDKKLTCACLEQELIPCRLPRPKKLREMELQVIDFLARGDVSADQFMSGLFCNWGRLPRNV